MGAILFPSQNTIWVNSSPSSFSSIMTPAPPMWLAKISSMYFSETGQSGISEAYANDATTLRVVGRTLKVSAPAGSQVVVANVGGMLIDHYTANGEAALTSLRPGIYIVKVNDKSSKIHIK